MAFTLSGLTDTTPAVRLIRPYALEAQLDAAVVSYFNRVAKLHPLTTVSPQGAQFRLDLPNYPCKLDTMARVSATAATPQTLGRGRSFTASRLDNNKSWRKVALCLWTSSHMPGLAELLVARGDSSVELNFVDDSWSVWPIFE